MSDVMTGAVAALAAKLPNGFDGVAKFVISDAGAIMVDADGVRAGDEAADVTLTASAEVFQAMLAGEMNPGLTTVSLPTRDLGRIAARQVLAALAGETIAQQSLLPFELLVRGTTARAL